MGQHSKLSPSGAYKWINCHGSIRMCDGLKDSSGKPAMTGSIAHCLGEICLVRNDDPSDYFGFWGWDNGKGGNGVQKEKPGPGENLPMVIKIDEKMAEDVTLYVDTIKATRAEMPSAKFLVEQHLDLTWLVPGMFGTADHAAIEFMGRAVIDDYKNGFTVVEVKDNPQFMIYALGVIGEDNDNMVEEVVMRVTQPNAFHAEGPVRSHVISVDELMDWGLNVLKPAALRALKPNAPVVAGEWCKWCLAKRFSVCPSHRARVFKSVDVMFDKEVVPVDPTPALIVPTEMSGEQLDKILNVSSLIKDWAKAVEEEAYRRVKAGAKNAPKLRKIVAGRKSRKWLDEKAVVEKVQNVKGVEAYDTKLKSVAQMEKALKKAGYDKDALADLVKVTRGEAMVSIDDKRPALVSGPDAMFK